MTRRLLGPLTVAALGFLLTVVHAADKPIPVKTSGKSNKTEAPSGIGDPRVRIEDAATQQDQLARQFNEFKASLMRLAQRLESSSRQEDRDKAAILRQAIKESGERGVDAKFATLVAALRSKDAFQDLDKLQEIMAQNTDLRNDIKRLLELLLKDDRDAQLKREREEVQRMLERLKEIIAKQERVRAKTDLGREKADALRKAQEKVTQDTKRLLEGKKDDKGAEAKKGDAKGEGKGDARGEAKDDAKDPKGDAKSQSGKEGKEGKGGEGKDAKSGEGKDGKPSEGKDGKGGEGKDGKAGEGKDGKPGEGKDGKSGEGKEGKPGADKEGKDGKGGEGKDGKGKEGKAGEPKDGKGGEGKEGKPGAGKDGKPGEAKSNSGKQGEGKPGAGKPNSDKLPGGSKNPGAPNKPGEGKSPAGQTGGAKAGEGKPGAGKSGKPSEAKSPDNKPPAPKSGSDSKSKPEGKGEAKTGNPSDSKSGGQSKAGESKSGGKPGQSGQSGQSQAGQSKSGDGQKGGQQQQQQNQQPQDAQAKKQIQDGNKYQEKSEDDLKKEDKNKAGEDQDKAIAKLKEAQKRLEELLRQLREEEVERLLAQLQARCAHMLALQIAVRDGTVNLDAVIQANDNKQPTRADEQASNVLSDKEEEIVVEASGGLRLLEAEGSAVAFAEVFKQVRGDMVTVAGRLRKTDTGKVTVTIENDIIDTLKEMIEALKKARQDNKNPPKPSQPGQGQKVDPRLIDLLAELKMIRSMQLRVNARTKVYGEQYEGEQAPPPAVAPNAKEREKYERIQSELKDLGVRQEKISKVTGDIAKGKNEAK